MAGTVVLPFLLLAAGIVALERLRAPRWVWALLLVTVIVVAVHTSCASCQSRWAKVKHKLGMALLNE